MRRLLSAGVALALLTGTSSAATPSAPPSPPIAQPGIDVRPAADNVYASADGQFVELGTVGRGTLLGAAVLVRNTAREAADVYVYAADAIPAVGGGFGVRLRSDSSTQVGAWLTLEDSQLTIGPRSEVRLEFQLRVPAVVAGGSYAGAIVAEPVRQPGGALQTVTRFAMAVTLEVPGGQAGATPGRGSPDGKLHLDDLTLEGDGEKVCPVVTYGNDSQDVLDPVAEIEVDGPFTTRRVERHKGVGAVAPEATTTAELPCVSRPVGPGQVTVTLVTPRGEEEKKVSTFWLPWPFVWALLMLLLLVGALLFTWARRRTKDDKEADADPAVVTTD